MRKTVSATQIIIGVVIVIIGVCHIIMAGTLPLFGDDLAYSRYDLYYGGSILYYPRWILRHWAFVNGRIANFIAPVFLYFLPLWVVKVCAGVMVSFWLWLMVRITRVERSLIGSSFVLAIVVFAYPWWDCFTIFVIQMNYIWSISAILMFLLMMRRSVAGKMSYLALLIVAAIAGMSHEAASLPLMCGLCVYVLFNGGIRAVDHKRRWALLVFMVATCLTCLSPGIISRLFSHKSADDTLIGMLISSAPVALIALCLIVICIAVLIVRRRCSIHQLAHQAWVVYAIAAIVSLISVAMGGIVGRSGWFAQSYALIAFCLLCRNMSDAGMRSSGLVGCIVAYVLLSAIVAHYLVWTLYQLRISAETQRVMEAYDASQDGVVYADIWRRDMQPYYLQMKVQGVPEYYDAYMLSTIWALRSDSTKVLTVLPTAFRGIMPIAADSASIAAEGKLALECLTYNPPGALSDTIPGCFGRRRVIVDSVLAIVVPVGGDSLYYVTRIPYDPTNPKYTTIQSLPH